MGKEIKTLNQQSLETLCKAIKSVADVGEIIDDENVATDKTYSSFKIQEELEGLETELYDYMNTALAGLNKLTKEVIDDTSLVVKDNVLYLYKDPASADNNYMQMMLINGVVVELGATEVDFSNMYNKTEVDEKFGLKIDLDTLTTEVTNIKSDLNTHKDDIDIHITSDERTKWNNTADKVNGEDLVKKADIKTTIDETSTNEDICSGKAIYDAIKANVIGKETVLYEGDIAAAGTYTLTDDVNNYDFIIINHRQASGVNCQSTTLSKYEISNCSDYEHKFMCVLGYGSSEDCTSGYFNNDKVIITAYANQTITSITGYKFGQVTVQNTITNPSPEQSYSLDEQLTGGTWIDGKPIYKKTVDCGALPNTSFKSVTHGINDIDWIIDIYGSAKGPDSTITLPFVHSNISYGVQLYCDKTLLRIYASSDKTACTKSYVTIEYTKTTD